MTKRITVQGRMPARTVTTRYSVELWNGETEELLEMLSIEDFDDASAIFRSKCNGLDAAEIVLLVGHTWQGQIQIASGVS